ncbi:MAG: peroxiredoxin [Bacillota bacterium]|nr:peroxiredoxin [Bacillota bacterium]
MDYNFKLSSNKRDDLSLESFKGQKLVLYFYPKDNTSGCTTEALEFTELYDKFKALNTEVVGVSRDSAKSHDNFSKKHNIPFELLVDKDRQLADQYGILKPGKMYGKDVIRTIRSTFVFDEDSNLIKEFRDVKPLGHAQEVLDFIKSLEK